MESNLAKDTVSIIIPCYNEQESLSLFHEEFIRATSLLEDLINFEIIFVDDGSKDGTIQEILRLKEIDARIFYISFSRNFGKEAAIYAGLKYSTGDYVVIMDADLQDPPELFPQMYKIVKEGGMILLQQGVLRERENHRSGLFCKAFL